MATTTVKITGFVTSEKYDQASVEKILSAITFNIDTTAAKKEVKISTYQLSQLVLALLKRVGTSASVDDKCAITFTLDEVSANLAVSDIRVAIRKVSPSSTLRGLAHAISLFSIELIKSDEEKILGGAKFDSEELRFPGSALYRRYGKFCTSETEKYYLNDAFDYMLLPTNVAKIIDEKVNPGVKTSR